jgi:Fe-S oxidoreductase
MIPGVSLIEVPESTWCWGAAGIYAITQPEQAELVLPTNNAELIQQKLGDQRRLRTSGDVITL